MFLFQYFSCQIGEKVSYRRFLFFFAIPTNLYLRCSYEKTQSNDGHHYGFNDIYNYVIMDVYYS